VPPTGRPPALATDDALLTLGRIEVPSQTAGAAANGGEMWEMKAIYVDQVLAAIGDEYEAGRREGKP